MRYDSKTIRLCQAYICDILSSVSYFRAELLFSGDADSTKRITFFFFITAETAKIYTQIPHQKGLGSKSFVIVHRYKT